MQSWRQREVREGGDIIVCEVDRVLVLTVAFESAPVP